MSQPMSRSDMQKLKVDTMESDRCKRIKYIVDDIYDKTVKYASRPSDHSNVTRVSQPSNAPKQTIGTKESCFHYEIPVVHIRTYNSTLRVDINSLKSDPFWIDNMKDIISGLKELFPECDVSHTIMATGRNGKMYDVARLDDTVLPFVDRALDQSYIVIDWS